MNVHMYVGSIMQWPASLHLEQKILGGASGISYAMTIASATTNSRSRFESRPGLCFLGTKQFNAVELT
jgi:hypothetical protein